MYFFYNYFVFGNFGKFVSLLFDNFVQSLCFYYLFFSSSKFVCLSFDKYSKVRLFIILQISTGLCVKYLTMLYKVFVFSIWHLRVFYKVCVFTIWSPPNWMRSCEKGGSGHLQPKLEGNSEFEETERKLLLWSKLFTTLTLPVSWQGQGHTQTISRKYEKSTLCDISNNLAIAKSLTLAMTLDLSFVYRFISSLQRSWKITTSGQMKQIVYYQLFRCSSQYAGLTEHEYDALHTNWFHSWVKW